MKEVQEKFFHEVMKQDLYASGGTRVYQELVYHRFYEVLSNANPIFHSLIKPQKFKKLVKKFILYGAKSEFVWQMPNEFRKFIKKDKHLSKKLPFVNDLLWFEWIEVELLMQDYSNFILDSFCFGLSYGFSKNAKIKKLKYDIATGNFGKKKRHYLIAFYNFDAKGVCFKEISNFMYQFIELQKNMSAKEALKDISKKYDIDAKEIKEDIREASKELCDLGILKKERRCYKK